MTLSLAVLASGRGSNFRAILNHIDSGRLEASVAIVISDRKEAGALQIARERGIPAVHIPCPRGGRRMFEDQAADLIEGKGCDLIILAGFMRVLSSAMVDRFRDRILNIHPSLLPAFRGLEAQKQALAAGVSEAGCTVHLVSAELDAGPILGQRRVAVLPDDTVETLSDRILEQEHALYAEAIAVYGEQFRSRSETAEGILP